ncbi:thiamine ABC transporter substrate binding subunit [Tessaracoccus sp. ZS01]|uniref:thiamine ABC transporter substrate-binding protein n=1 Tax=Tessaracoccus sp. ZS01 TaxID=1906324 RepID=UPI00096D40BD|nr:thiamine ABC transporter substrate-binding protein [Tessaracoccus sp. ZS01]MCG6567747.1 thiamine ABC transporter substrate-binding protein [Tessaracoccus sp. ZS01]OMG55492.1 thiamine ABC transporter substrate-binding protein [Tessaracoccus sp. ZS01]
MKFFAHSAIAGTAVLALAACGGAATPGGTDSPAGETSEAVTSSSTLTVVTHDSFSLPDDLKAKFAEESGLDVTYVQPGDSGTLVNQLILTKDSPLGDVVFGIDNTYASRAAEEGVLSGYESEALPEEAEAMATEGLTPIDFGDVCINADKRWFAEHDVAIPATLDDLLKPEYKDLLVVTHPASSSPGLAFLLATIGEKGDGWLDYWSALADNGLKVASGWTEAYYTDFSGADGAGPRPLVLSYATSPAYTVDGDESTTEALLDTCFRQVEYAGVLAGAQNEEGARAFVDFLLSPDVQSVFPTEMYMYPAVTDTELPEEWARFAPLAPSPVEVSPEEIDANRDQWIRDWTEAMG